MSSRGAFFGRKDDPRSQKKKISGSSIGGVGTWRWMSRRSADQSGMIWGGAQQIRVVGELHHKRSIGGKGQEVFSRRRIVGDSGVQ